ncbi:Palmitoyltransferase zdhhc15 [Perkinsus olseni]|uniref:Palmitoyltransferase zdhhc15 n=1 Tax=Perkinsus olseni TaxID=32597 RepID=A0A7J6T4P1_PEROL|nr:Palmitoyltransferase zdhhc15 [Perkinsus olseni]
MPDSPPSFPSAPATVPDREPARFLPVIFVCTIIFTLWGIYNFVHVLPLLQLDRPAVVHHDVAQKGWIELIIFNSLFAMLLVCYTLCVVVSPGEIPDTDEWLCNGEEDEPVVADSVLPDAQEKKRSGERRRCKWCGK